MNDTEKNTYVVLVDQEDKEIGVSEKMAAHEGGGQLHRAFSIFIMNSLGELLLQRRALAKYHGAGLWANSCCGHPLPGSNLEESAKRRLDEELGFSTPVHHIGAVLYKVPFDNGLTEWELDHILVGNYDEEVIPNPDEIDEWKWVDINWLVTDLEKRPDIYVPWLPEILPTFLSQSMPLN